MDASPSFICVLLGCHQMLSDRMLPRRAGPSLWAAEGGPGPRATGGWGRGGCSGGRAGGQVKTRSCPCPPGGPQLPAGARLAAQASCAHGALWCPGAVTARVPAPPARPAPQRVIAKTPGTAARLHLPSRVSWVPPEPQGADPGALRVFYFFSKTVPKTGRSLGARPLPRGRRLLPMAAPAREHSPGSHRAPSGPRCPSCSDGATASPHPAAPRPLPSAALATICVWGSTRRRKGGFSLWSPIGN